MNEETSIDERVHDLLSECSMSTYKNWRDHPITKALVLAFEDARQSCIDQYMSGSLTAETLDGTYQLMTRNLGFAQGVDALVRWVEEDVKITIQEIEEEDNLPNLDRDNL